MCPDDSEIETFLSRARRACRGGRVRLTRKALGEAWEELCWESPDILLQIEALVLHDFYDLVESTARPGEQVWVFCPETTFEGSLYVRLVERDGLIVVSFHRR
jgi:hypothetical protein